MKRKISLSMLALTALLVLGLVGCQRGRTDAQIAGDVQTRINSDPAVQSRCLVQGQCSAQVSKGVVTLAGTVANDAERSAIANDAAQVEGVRTVVNNLQVAPPVTAMAEPEPQPVAPEPVRAEPKPRSKSSAAKPAPRRASSGGYAGDYSEPAPNYASNPPAVQAPPAPVAPAHVTIPEGTTISVRLVDPIDSEKNRAGDQFRATLDSAVMVGNTVAIPAGADVYGRVTDAKNASHFSGRSELALELTRLSLNGKAYEIRTDQFARQGKARGKNTAAKVGTGAAIGAIIGGIAGGGKGAAIGGAIGAGAGTGAQAVTRGEQVRLTSEQSLAFHLESPLTVAPTSRLDRNAGRQRLDE